MNDSGKFAFIISPQLSLYFNCGAALTGAAGLVGVLGVVGVVEADGGGAETTEGLGSDTCGLEPTSLLLVSPRLGDIIAGVFAFTLGVNAGASGAFLGGGATAAAIVSLTLSIAGAEGAPIPDRDGGGADTLTGERGDPMPDSDFGGEDGLTGVGEPMPDKDGGGAETFIGAGGAPMPDKDFGGVAVFAGAGGEPIPDSDIGGDDFAGAAGAAGPRLLVAGVAAFAGVAFAAACPLSFAPPPDAAGAFVGVEVVLEGEDFAAACPLSFAPPPEEPLFDGEDFAAA